MFHINLEWQFLSDSIQRSSFVLRQSLPVHYCSIPGGYQGLAGRIEGLSADWEPHCGSGVFAIPRHGSYEVSNYVVIHLPTIWVEIGPVSQLHRSNRRMITGIVSYKNLPNVKTQLLATSYIQKTIFTKQPQLALYYDQNLVYIKCKLNFGLIKF